MSDQTCNSAPLRKIIHVDMDAFFAAVEQLDNPALRGKPIAVGHSSERGVVATASYEARQFGVRSAMPSVKAKRLCPHIIFVPGRMDRYKEISAQINTIFQSYTNLVEPLSLDEAYLDVTTNKPRIALAVDIARQIKSRIRSEIGLVASAGISYNKFLAKIASDHRKPDGLCTIHPSQALSFIDKLPIERFWSVGPATAKKMHSLGIHNGADLRQWPIELLSREFGKSGQIFYNFARGIDTRQVTPQRIRKSIGCERTFSHDLFKPDDIRQVLASLSQELEQRFSNKKFLGNTLTLKIKFHNFVQVTRSHTQQSHFTSAQQILEQALKLAAEFNFSDSAVRLFGLTVSNPIIDIEQPESQFFTPEQLLLNL